MKAEEKIRLTEKNIRQALRDYGRHTSNTEVLDDVSDAFIRRLAKDNYYAKQELRELFKKSPVWNKEPDALVINRTWTHDPDYHSIKDLMWQILDHPIRTSSYEGYHHIMDAIPFFSEPSLSEDMKTKAIAAINFKLFVSLNPAHFITMSNPKHDTRGDTLTSSHSFNSTEYPITTAVPATPVITTRSLCLQLLTL